MGAHQCDPSLYDRKLTSYHNSFFDNKDKKDIYEVLCEDVKEFVKLECGKCIIELYKAVIDALPKEEKNKTLKWLFDISIAPPDYIDLDEDSIVFHLCNLAAYKKNWSKEEDPVQWLRERLQRGYIPNMEDKIVTFFKNKLDIVKALSKLKEIMPIPGQFEQLLDNSFFQFNDKDLPKELNLVFQSPVGELNNIVFEIFQNTTKRLDDKKPYALLLYFNFSRFRKLKPDVTTDDHIENLSKNIKRVKEVPN